MNNTTPVDQAFLNLITELETFGAEAGKEIATLAMKGEAVPVEQLVNRLFRLGSVRDGIEELYTKWSSLDNVPVFTATTGLPNTSVTVYTNGHAPVQEEEATDDTPAATFPTAEPEQPVSEASDDPVRKNDGAWVDSPANIRYARSLARALYYLPNKTGKPSDVISAMQKSGSIPSWLGDYGGRQRQEFLSRLEQEGYIKTDGKGRSRIWTLTDLGIGLANT